MSKQDPKVKKSPPRGAEALSKIDSVGAKTEQPSVAIQHIPISRIKANPSNPRVMRDEKFAKLKKSLTDFPDMLNYRTLVAVTDGDHYMVLGGNMRLRAMQDLGIKTAPVMLADHWTEEQRREFIIKDNVGYGEWNYDDLANEWDAGDLDDWGLDLPFLGHEVNNMTENDLDMSEEFDPVGVPAGQQRVVFIFDGPKEAESWLKREPSLQVKKAGTAWTVNLSTRYT